MRKKQGSPEKELEKTISLLKATLDSTTDGILAIDKQNYIATYNKKFLQMWSIPESLLEKKSADLVINYLLEQIDNPKGFLQKIHDLQKNIHESSYDIVHLKNDKTFERYSQPQELNGKIIGRVWSFRDITEQSQLEEQLLKQSKLDSLTGLPNRVLLLDRLQHAMSYAKHMQTQFAILMLDLDHFKKINDSLGHRQGDKLLQMVAQRLLENVRENDTVARLGGDEFVVILTGLKQEADAVPLIEHLLKSIAFPFKIDYREVTITASIGVNFYREENDHVAELLRDADTAMYRSKAAGRNTYHFYEQGTHEQIIRRLEMESDLRRAITQHELQLYYQPIVDIQSKKTIGAEALLRWPHPHLGFVQPQELVSIAEESDLIISLGETVLMQACQHIRSWLDAGLKCPHIAVNISASQFMHSDIVTLIKQALKKYSIEPEYLDLELTESLFIENREDIIEKILILSELGCSFSIDDFGTGYSSLSYIKHFPIHKLKIDISFIRDLLTDANNAALVKSIIALAENLNLQTIAEGVEEKEQLDLLRKYRCDAVQGYYFSRPINYGEFTHWLQRH